MIALVIVGLAVVAFMGVLLWYSKNDRSKTKYQALDQSDADFRADDGSDDELYNMADQLDFDDPVVDHNDRDHLTGYSSVSEKPSGRPSSISDIDREAQKLTAGLDDHFDADTWDRELKKEMAAIDSGGWAN
eukprot:c6081_g1_i1.p1 GENE.c6081_g1_i1~~c6081_g1_i1.p1  ORF type:complete len:154 (+),score=49.23 c6081_g1_i1:68-463(+)